MKFNNNTNKCPSGYAIGSVLSPETDRLEKIATGDFVESLDFCDLNISFSSITREDYEVSQEDLVYRNQVKSILTEILKNFNGRTNAMMKMRFEDGMSFQSIANQFHLSQERVIQIIHKSLSKLKEVLISKNFILEF